MNYTTRSRQIGEQFKSYIETNSKIFTPEFAGENLQRMVCAYFETREEQEMVLDNKIQSDYDNSTFAMCLNDYWRIAMDVYVEWCEVNYTILFVKNASKKANSHVACCFEKGKAISCEIYFPKLDIPDRFSSNECSILENDIDNKEDLEGEDHCTVYAFCATKKMYIKTFCYADRLE